MITSFPIANTDVFAHGLSHYYEEENGCHYEMNYTVYMYPHYISKLPSEITGSHLC